jgi:hypothetical protein
VARNDRGNFEFDVEGHAIIRSCHRFLVGIATILVVSPLSICLN